MIKFGKNNDSAGPIAVFKQKYDEALSLNQDVIQAAAIASFSKSLDEVDIRFVNIKHIEGNNLIFFTNYNSPKSQQFEEHGQVGVTFFWSKSNTQIRIQGTIRKTSKKYNLNYFKNRALKKNILAIASDQSQEISSYEEMIRNYDQISKNEDLDQCPDYWGGFKITPYKFEFWKGHENRLNYREEYNLNKKKWHKKILQP
jgi:pyridoxamine 5'-phosphate oxidase